jgi:3-hydroxyacyl-[acyl-carrier-protein] dehydratase
MILTDFYKIEQTTPSDSGTVFHIKLNPEHVIYKGHFPGQPVLPGVCMLQMIKECAQQLIDAPITNRRERLQYTRIVSCKFLRFVDPVQCNEITLTVSLNEKEDGTFLLIANGISSDAYFIKVKAIMKNYSITCLA